MLINDFGLIGGWSDARACGDRGARSRLIAMAIGAKSTDDTNGWHQVADRIAMLAPDFATLLRFIRREPALLRSYFADESRVGAMIGQGGPTDRLLVGYAHDLAMAGDISIVDLTERRATARAALRTRASLRSTAGRTPSTRRRKPFVADAGGDFRAGLRVVQVGACLRAPGAAEIIAAGPKTGAASSSGAIWPSLSSAGSRRSPIPRSTFQLSLRPEEKARVVRLQMPGQFAA